MIALTASNTETCTMAMALTVMGGAGIRDTMSAARAFASVTTSARASGATTDSSIATRTQRHGVGLHGGTSLVTVYTAPVRRALAAGQKSVRDAIVGVTPKGVAMPALTLSLLGGFRARLDERSLTLSKKAQALLAHLALSPGHTQPRARLAGLLWGDRADEQARNSLRQTLFELRRVLGPGGERCLIADHERVALDPSNRLRGRARARANVRRRTRSPRSNGRLRSTEGSSWPVSW